MNFKRKYHSSYSKSAIYAAREAEAYSKLLRNLGKYGVDVVRVGEGVLRTGVVDEEGPRFDFMLKVRRVDDGSEYVICYVEVTGDFIDDIYAYILSEKIESARKANYPVFIMYDKRRKRLWRVFSMRYIALKLDRGDLEMIKWLEDEKPYIKIPLAKGWYFARWVTWLRTHVIPYIMRRRENYNEWLNTWRVR